MTEGLRWELTKIWPVYRSYMDACIDWLELERGNTLAEQVRAAYHEVGVRKQLLDKMILDLKQGYDPVKAKTDWHEQEKGNWIDTLYFTAQSMELWVVKLCGNYLKLHQRELFWPEQPKALPTTVNQVAPT